MRGEILIALALLFSFSFVSGASNQNLDSLLGNVSGINTYLQSNEVFLPDGAERIISDGTVAANITRLDGTVKGLYVVVQSKRLTSFSEGFPGESAYQIFVSEETVNTLAAQDSPDVLGAYKEGKIVIEADGIGNNIKLFFAKLFLKFVN